MDLITVTALGLLLVAWLGCAFMGERGRTARCAGNLKDLGGALRDYATDHNGAIPPAGIMVEKYQNSWDLEVLNHLIPGLAQEDQAKLAQTVPRYFACPSDSTSHAGPPRSYAMSSNDMTLQYWPPGPDSATGLGLTWDKPAVLRLLDAVALKQPEQLPGMKLAQIPDPSGTVLLTEFLVSENVMGKPQFAAAAGSALQRLGVPDGGAGIHGGRLNYLMADGHLERLSLLQTRVIDATAGIWTLKKGD